MTNGTPRPRADELDPRLLRAVELGIVTEDVAREIAAIEVDESRTPDLGGRLSERLAEAIGFVGAALVLLAAVLLVSQFWADLRPWSRVALPGLAAVVLLAAGLAVRGRDTGAFVRLTGFLWFLSAGSFAFAIGLLGDDILDLVEAETLLLASGVTTMYALVLWYLRRQALQQIAFYAALLVAAGSGLDVIDQTLLDYIGLLFWAIGVGWLLLSWGRVVAPKATGYALGGLTVILAPAILAFEFTRPGILLGLVSAVLLVVASVTLRRAVMLWFGALGIFIHVPWIVFEFFGEALGAPLALFVVGVVLVAAALGIGRIQVAHVGTEGD